MWRSGFVGAKLRRRSLRDRAYLGGWLWHRRGGVGKEFGFLLFWGFGGGNGNIGVDLSMEGNTRGNKSALELVNKETWEKNGTRGGHRSGGGKFCPKQQLNFT